MAIPTLEEFVSRTAKKNNVHPVAIIKALQGEAERSEDEGAAAALRELCAMRREYIELVK